MKYSRVYVVMNEGEVVYASTNNETAIEYADSRMYEAREEVLESWGNDDPSEKDSPLYNFIHESQMTKVPISKPLQRYLILLWFRHFSRKWQKLSAGLSAGSVPCGTPARSFPCSLKIPHLYTEVFSLHSKQC